MSAQRADRRLKAEALRLGFDQVGIAPAVPPPGYPDFLDWLEAGHAAGMEYLQRQAPSRVASRALLDGVRSVVMVSVVYGRTDAGGRAASRRPRARSARYARGRTITACSGTSSDALLDWLRTECPEAPRPRRGRHGPAARTRLRPAGRAGLDRQEHDADRPPAGQLHLPGRLLTDVELAYDPPHDGDHCGTCTRCLDACPTDAFAGPYELDARRCISYWTIEHRGPIPDDAAGQLDGWVFGCDVCQDVCPWNRKAPPGRSPSSRRGRSGPIPT